MLEENQAVSAEGVAAILARMPNIGIACAALREAGWHATIAANRITVNNFVFAQYLGCKGSGPDCAMWMVHTSAESSPIEIAAEHL